MREPRDQALARRIKRLRLERAMSQEALAFEADLTASALSRIERGLNDPRWTTVLRIAEALDVGVREIAGE